MSGFAVLEALALVPEDRLLDVGTGDRTLAEQAMASGAIVIPVTHDGDLPFEDGMFTAVALSVPPTAALLAECLRVLTEDGRLAALTTGLSDDDLLDLGDAAGFGALAVVEEDDGTLLLTARRARAPQGS